MKLKSSAIYGIRVYRRGSTLFNHVDRRDTHIISAIINVAQKVNGRCGSCARPYALVPTSKAQLLIPHVRHRSVLCNWFWVPTSFCQLTISVSVALA